MRVRPILLLAPWCVLGLAIASGACVGDDPLETPADAAIADGASGAVVETDAGTRPFLYAFVTSNTHIGRFPPPDGAAAVNGLAGADAFCKAAADAGSATQLRGKKWAAWLSVGDKRASERLPIAKTGDRDLAYEYRLHDGVTVVFPQGFYLGGKPADGGALSYAIPQNAINLDENHAGPLTYTVWTGTEAANLGPAVTCDGWNSAAELGTIQGTVGTTSVPPSTKWTQDGDKGSLACDSKQSVYCFELP